MSDGPDLLERTRMALFDVGEDPESVSWSPNTPGTLFAPGLWYASDDQVRLLWAAEQIASFAPGGVLLCWACQLDHRDQGTAYAATLARCTAYLPLTEDCGVDRDPT